MDFIDEENVALLEIGEKCSKIAGLGDHRARSRTEIDTQFARDDLREGGLAETGRPGKEDMIEGLAAPLGCFDEDFEILFGPALADEFGKRLRTQMRIELVFGLLLAIDEPCVHAVASSLRERRINRSVAGSSPAFLSAALTAAPA